MKQKSFEELEKMDTKDMTLHEKGMLAFQRAIDEVILEHQHLKLPLWIKRNGKLEAVSADELLKEKQGMNS